MKALILALAFLAAGAQAAEGAPELVGLHLYTVHLDRQEYQMPVAYRWGDPIDGKPNLITETKRWQWNSNTLGAYARWRDGFTVGTYRNSRRGRSYYAGWTLHDETDTFAITLGLVTGYDRPTRMAPGLAVATRCDNGTCKRTALKSVVLPLIVPSVRIPISDRVSARISALVPPGDPPAIHLSLEYRL